MHFFRKKSESSYNSELAIAGHGTRRKVATGDTAISTYAHVDGVAVAALRLRCFRFLFPGDRCRGQGGVRQLIEWRRASLADATLARKNPNSLSLRRKQ
jgi:hypothetical protein